ncbi:hypothetical protein I2W78_16240 [Streptomyces spinoverrucosus]|uniref:hypothetical protein n=1 Tax=Streptomyces spinoverrucosus TaxID=284043 RepID=UPI0018C35665|nr:hypothetical protein [Streptomyces spinoverrucosus]MBG0853354.1 hypothetical protein [Streptomyces spinoverrucosus]
MRKRATIVAIAAVLPLTAAGALAGAGSAAADPTKATVTVTGEVEDCANGNSPNRVTIETNDGDETRTDKSGVAETNEYSVKFTKISKKGDGAQATVTCKGGGTYTDEFTIKRPKQAGVLVQERDLEAP